MNKIGTNIDKAAALLRAGGLVAIPTETVYGLGAGALSAGAVAGIFGAKNRPSFDPLIIHQSSAERILTYAREVSPTARRLAEACWPGPLTLVLPKVASVPDLVTSGLDTVALRVPDHPLTRELLAAVDFPVAAPSANPFGFVSPVTAGHVVDQLGERVDYILDGGRCRVGLESSIVRIDGGEVTLLRQGGLPQEVIEEIVGHPIATRTHGSSRPEAPGMLSKHYSPGKPLRLVDRLRPAHTQVPGLALMGFNRGNTGWVDYDLSPTGDLHEAARNLFVFLRRIAAAPHREVIAELVPERGLGRAINDRLRRAAAS